LFTKIIAFGINVISTVHMVWGRCKGGEMRDIPKWPGELEH